MPESFGTVVGIPMYRFIVYTLSFRSPRVMLQGQARVPRRPGRVARRVRAYARFWHVGTHGQGTRASAAALARVVWVCAASVPDRSRPQEARPKL